MKGLMYTAYSILKTNPVIMSLFEVQIDMTMTSIRLIYSVSLPKSYEYKLLARQMLDCFLELLKDGQSVCKRFIKND